MKGHLFEYIVGLGANIVVVVRVCKVTKWG